MAMSGLMVDWEIGWEREVGQAEEADIRRGGSSTDSDDGLALGREHLGLGSVWWRKKLRLVSR